MGLRGRPVLLCFLTACLWAPSAASPDARPASRGRPPPAASAAHEPATDRTDLEIEGNILRYRGKPLRFFDRAESWLAAIGKPERVREDGSGQIYSWDSAGLELAAIGTPDGRAYASHLRIRLDRCAVGLMGVALGAQPRYREVQKAVAPRAVLADRPARDLAFADMALPTPDGFRVSLIAPLRCPVSDTSRFEPTRYRGHIPLPRASGGDPCEFYFEELEISADGYTGWH